MKALNTQNWNPVVNLPPPLTPTGLTAQSTPPKFTSPPPPPQPSLRIPPLPQPPYLLIFPLNSIEPPPPPGPSSHSSPTTMSLLPNNMRALRKATPTPGYTMEQVFATKNFFLLFSKINFDILV